MVELHKKLEMLLRNLKTEFKIHGHNPPDESNCSNVYVQETEEHHYCEQDPNCQYTSSGSNQFRREKSLRMDQLEAELTAEFNHLQCQMNADTYTGHNKHHISEVHVLIMYRGLLQR